MDTNHPKTLVAEPDGTAVTTTHVSAKNNAEVNALKEQPARRSSRLHLVERDALKPGRRAREKMPQSVKSGSAGSR